MMSKLSKKYFFCVICLIFISGILSNKGVDGKTLDVLDNIEGRKAIINNNANLSCPDKAISPICGAGGFVYSNACHFSRSIQRWSLSTEWGNCECDTPDGEPCSEKVDPVCGSDGKKYKNRCYLLTASCKNRGMIFETDDRPPNCKVRDCPETALNPSCSCPDNIDCSINKTKNLRQLYANPCLAGKNHVKVDGIIACFCKWFDKKCPTKKEEVCGNDRHVYLNRCELMYFACNYSHWKIHEVPMECCKSPNKISSDCL